MKRLSLALSAAFLAAAAGAQETPPAATPPVPVPPAPQSADSPAPAASPFPFQSDVERRSYGLGAFLGNQEKNNAAAGLIERKFSPEEVLAGVRAVLTKEHSIEYAAGVAIGSQILRSGVEVEPQVLLEAMKGAMAGEEGKLSQEQISEVMREIQKKINDIRAAKLKEEADRNLEAANEFLARNGREEGVVTTDSGLQYRITEPGNGNPPSGTDLVTLNLRGTLVDGTEFERNPEGKPMKRSVGSLVKGLQEGVQLLRPGGKARFWVPPALGFGERGNGRSVRGNAALIYDVELVSAEPAPAPARPVSAVTPPVAVDIPPAPAKDGNPDAKQQTPPAATPPVQVPPAAPDK